MIGLITTPNITKADDFYQSLVDAHEGISKDQSDALNARLILLLANHIGDLSVIQQALDLARLEAGSIQQPHQP